jgi:hypothetical protein
MNAAEKIAYTVPEALAAVGIGRTNLYKLAKEGKLDLRKVGGRTLVSAASLRRLILEAEAAYM